jgi:Ca-activated chloride channel family protein
MSRWLASLASLSALALPALVLPAQEADFKVGVSLVRVVATVKNQAGELVGSLTKDDFDVFDNGVKQELKVFERQTDQPLSVVLMIDTSGSTGKDLKYETDSAGRFLRALLSEGSLRDAASLYSFNADITLHQDFTHDYAALERRFRFFKPEGATALYDAIRQGARALEPREGRKVIVVVTDGSNTMPNSATSHQALESAQLADAVIYPIVVVPITNEAGRSIGGEHALIFMAEGTGGRTFMPMLGPQLDKVFEDIISELRTQYMLGFYPRGVPPSKERYHSLDVRLKRPELQVSARKGYYGDVEIADVQPASRISVTPERTVAPPKSGKKR